MWLRSESSHSSMGKGVSEGRGERSESRRSEVGSEAQSLRTTGSDNVKVVVRVRPPLSREISGDVFISTVDVHPDHSRLLLFQYCNLHQLNATCVDEYINNPKNFMKHEYTFDHVYDDQSSQEEVYENTAKLSVCSALEGYNATIFAYGQTGTGKTYTMEGFKYDMHEEERGIIPRAIEEIFKYIESCEDQDITFMVRASYIQIYNETISDLLRNDRKALQIREDTKKGVYVEGVSEWAVVRPEEILDLMKRGAKSRATAKTNMNELSSRSHAVFIITVEQMLEGAKEGKLFKVAKLNLVDLAGSQRVRVTGASGKRLEECKNINVSLSCLGMVIAALTESRPQSHIPYRNSIITRMLSDSLGGNCKTTMLTMISSAPQAFPQTLSSIKFAHRAKSIRNRPAVNEDLDQKALIRKYETELSRLRGELEEKSKVLVDKSKLIQLEEEKKRIEEDKHNVEKALQQRSNEFFKEREQKRMLEEKIKAFNSQLVHGGLPLEKAFAEQRRIIQQYEHQIQSLESEKDRHLDPQLFQKQNQILMSLAAKLNQRDQANSYLNEELWAYDRITKETESELTRKTIRLEMLEKLLKKHGIPVPEEERECKVKKREDHLDGVVVEGEMTYNITEKNLRRSEEEIFALKEVNGQQKEEIQKLKQMLKKDAPIEACEDGYKSIRESIDIITKGIKRKQNTDMKTIITQILKIKKIVGGAD